MEPTELTVKKYIWCGEDISHNEDRVLVGQERSPWHSCCHSEYMYASRRAMEAGKTRYSLEEMQEFFDKECEHDYSNGGKHDCK